MKRLCIYILAALVLFAACKKPDNPQPAEGTEETTTEQTPETNNPTTTTMNEQPAAPADKWAELGEEPMLKIKTTDGTMTVKLYAETPLHRDNFVKLARSGFYNGLLFHRIIKGFMIQGGDPFTKDSTKIAQFGTGGPGYTIPAEIVAGKTHKKGALAAARRGDQVNPAKESSGSQFYIVQDEEGCKHLDGEYTVFGQVVDGLEVVQYLTRTPTDEKEHPLKEIRIKRVIVRE